MGAFIAQTRTKTTTMALCGGRISGGRARTRSSDDPNGWQMPTSAIVFTIVDGPARARQGRVPFRTTCVQAEFFGADLRAATALYEQWYQDFYPSDENATTLTPSGFIAAHTAVAGLEQIGSPVAFYGIETAWPKVSITLLVSHSEVPTNGTTYRQTVSTTQEQAAV